MKRRRSSRRKAPVTRRENDDGEGKESKQNGRLMVRPNNNHVPQNYNDLESNFPSQIFTHMETYLPINMLNVPRNDKANYIRHILNDYLPPQQHTRDKKRREYRQKILSNYKPLHKKLYTLDPSKFFVPTFLKAIKKNTEQSFRSIISEPSPGIFTFEMLQPRFCELLVSEVENFEKWVNATKFQVIRPSTINKYGVVLDDFGFQTMLDKLMKDFISPLSKVFFAEIGGTTLDSHHGFIVEYGEDKDIDMGFHVDDAEVTLNVCLGRQFSGGELFFRGMRCDQHLHTISHPEEIYDYFHFPGRAVLHHGRHRHGARATTSGNRFNLLLWCRSSVFRQMKTYKTDFSGWCGVCYQEKKNMLLKSIDETELKIANRIYGLQALSKGKGKGKAPA
ncbi:hypothetical protein RJT34_04871 [Clitoria ternatea]|uniref:Fe2OG dioxygenase domain-containing protein n=1 Tax=Clitoria ternatea TaxID=43366 RepID=A0AAN9KPV1_CLITE